LTDIVSRIDYPDLEQDMRRVCAGEEVPERSVSHVSGSGYYLARILPYRVGNNQIDGVLLTFVEVTNLVAAEEQQKVLAAELSHCVKNTLAVVSSIAERTLSDGHAKENLIGRLHALGHTHDVLSESGWTEAGLRELISAELSPHGVGDGALQISGPPVMLRPQAALFLTLALHELSTNAAKYGALSVPGGRVAVSWIITGDRPPQLEIDWQEEGGPKVDGFGAAGFGTELIERGIRFELQGEAKLETVNGGLHCRIVIPANPQNLTFGSRGNRQRVEDPP
jgi:two-component system CheB/CheR fusion protein